MRFGLAQILAEEALDVAARPPDASQDACGEGNHLSWNAARLARRRQRRIAIPRIGQSALVQPVEERGTELSAPRCAESYRVREAVLERHAVVPHSRRKVDEVAGAGDEASALDAPGTPARPLYQEHVVVIDMGPDAAAARGVAHHDVVQPRLRHEMEALQQGVGVWDVQVDAVHEQGPAGRPRFRIPERTVARHAPPAAAFHDAGLDIMARREGAERARVDQLRELRQRIAHEKSALLPITPQKIARRQAAEHSQLHSIDYCSARTTNTARHLSK